jgi:hypothetical protein
VVQVRVPRVKVEIEHFLDVELVGTRIAEEQTGGHGDGVADKVHTLVTPLKSEPRNGEYIPYVLINSDSVTPNVFLWNWCTEAAL